MQLKMWTRIVISLTVAMAMAATGAALVKWVMLGERVVNDRVDHDSISVGAARGEFSAIKLRVLKRPVHFLDVKVHFANGHVQDVKIKKVIGAGRETRVIDLAGDDRLIERVEFWYEAETARRGRRSEVRLLGRR
jgi:hypothetical protein